MSESDQKNLWPTYALRAWLTGLFEHVRRTKGELEMRIEAQEKEVARSKRQRERAEKILGSLQSTIDRVDDRLRMIRDSESRPEHSESHHGASEAKGQSVSKKGVDTEGPR